MRGLKRFLKDNLFKLLVFVSVCVIFYYTAGSKILHMQNSASSQNNNCSATNNSQAQKDQEDFKNEIVLKGKPLRINSSPEDKVKVNPPAINNIRLAELKNGEQTVVMEDNSQQQGTDVILAAKGVRAKWIFRFKDGNACNGKILIERFGMIIPVAEKEMEITFAPLKDFTVTCDKGKFNYYIKVVDNLNIALSPSTTQTKNTQKTSAPSNVYPSTKSSSVSSASTKQNTTSSNTQVNPKENENKSALEPSTPINKPVPSPSISPSSNQEPAVSNENASKPKGEAKKGGILDHIFHHNH